MFLSVFVSLSFRDFPPLDLLSTLLPSPFSIHPWSYQNQITDSKIHINTIPLWQSNSTEFLPSALKDGIEDLWNRDVRCLNKWLPFPQRIRSQLLLRLQANYPFQEQIKNEEKKRKQKKLPVLLEDITSLLVLKKNLHDLLENCKWGHLRFLAKKNSRDWHSSLRKNHKFECWF